MKIKSRDRIKIGSDSYDVLGISGEIDRFDVENDKFVGEHTAIELHKDGSLVLHATHLLKIW